MEAIAVERCLWLGIGEYRDEHWDYRMWLCWECLCSVLVQSRVWGDGNDDDRGTGGEFTGDTPAQSLRDRQLCPPPRRKRSTSTGAVCGGIGGDSGECGCEK